MQKNHLRNLLKGQILGWQPPGDFALVAGMRPLKLTLRAILDTADTPITVSGILLNLPSHSGKADGHLSKKDILQGTEIITFIMACTQTHGSLLSNFHFINYLK